MQAHRLFFLSLILLPAAGVSEEVWRCAGHLYTSKPDASKNCVSVDATTSQGSKGTRLFLPKGGTPRSQPKSFESFSRNTRQSGFLFETDSTRPLKSSVMKNDCSDPANASNPDCAAGSGGAELPKELDRLLCQFGMCGKAGAE